LHSFPQIGQQRRICSLFLTLRVQWRQQTQAKKEAQLTTFIKQKELNLGEALSEKKYSIFSEKFNRLHQYTLDLNLF